MGFSIASPNEEKIHDSKSSVQGVCCFCPPPDTRSVRSVPSTLLLFTGLYCFHFPVQIADAKAVKSGFMTAVLCASAAAVPTLIGCRTIPWAKANLNHTAQALIISAAGVAGFFITADRTILENARGNTIGKHDK